MLLLIAFLLSIWLSGFLAGAIITLKKSTKHLKEQNDLLEKQNQIIAHCKLHHEDAADWWKPDDWKADWGPGDA